MSDGQKRKIKREKKEQHKNNAAWAGTDLRMARDTFCFQGLSLRMPMPKPERKNSSPVVTRSHFCEASNSSTAESQMKACSLLLAEGGRGEEGVTVPQYSDCHNTHLRLPFGHTKCESALPAMSTAA